MRSLARAALHFLKDEEGPTAVEYAVMLAMIIILCVVIVRQIGTTTSQSFSAANSAFS